MINLFGAFAIHNPESCPMNNVESNKVFLEIKDKLEKNESAHDIENLCIQAGIGSFNTVKIVSLKRYDDVHNKIGK